MCYQCSKCNHCGKFSYRAAVLCKTCDGEVPAGCFKCPSCGSSTLGNIYVEKMIYDPEAPVRSRASATRNSDDE